MTAVKLTLEHCGASHTCRVYVPDHPASQAGLVVMLQPTVGSGDDFARMTRFDNQAERMGWVAAYPDAINPGVLGGWDTYSCCPNEFDDVGFISRLSDTLTAKHRIDPNRLFVAGFSRGGMMAHRIGCELSGQVVGIAAVAGNLADFTGSADAVPCAPAQPVAVLMIHGTDDREVPVKGGTSPDYPDLFPYAPLSDVVRRWTGLNRCSGQPTLRQEGDITIRRWDGAARVELHLITGGGHEWFARHEYDASQAIADFFATTGTSR